MSGIVRSENGTPDGMLASGSENADLIMPVMELVAEVSFGNEGELNGVNSTVDARAMVFWGIVCGLSGRKREIGPRKA